MRVAIGEAFGLPQEKLLLANVAALKKIGFDRVYDTAFSADLTVIEEAEEFSGAYKRREAPSVLLLVAPPG